VVGGEVFEEVEGEVKVDGLGNICVLSELEMG
jgi:hypothetical protein